MKNLSEKFKDNLIYVDIDFLYLKDSYDETILEEYKDDYPYDISLIKYFYIEKVKQYVLYDNKLKKIINKGYQGRHKLSLKPIEKYIFSQLRKEKINNLLK